MTATLSAPKTMIGFGNVLRSEWTKLRSVRSTYWTVLVAALGTIGVAVLVCIQWRDGLLSGKDSLDGFDATLTSINGIYLAQVAIGTLVCAVSSAISSARTSCWTGLMMIRRSAGAFGTSRRTGPRDRGDIRR
jgi:hypothetical protein